MPTLINTLLNTQRDSLRISAVLVLRSCLLSGTLSCKLYLPWVFFWTLSSISSIQVIHWVVPGYTHFVICVGNFLKVVSQSTCRAHIIYFP